MPENAQTESTIVPVNFNNHVLKQWLHSVGPVRRCEVLKKFKEYLQALGLSKRQVHRGIVQLATKPHVVITHVSPGRRNGVKNPLEEDVERKGEDCRRDSSFLEHSQLSYEEEVQTPSTTENSITEDSKLVQRSNRLKTSASSDNIDGLTASSTDSKLMNHSTDLFHSFDKALEQLDELMCTKMSGNEKSHSKRTPDLVSSYSTRKSRCVDSTNAKEICSNKKSKKSSANDENKDIRLNRKTTELTHDKKGTSIGPTRDLAKKTRVKLDLMSYYRKRQSECIKCEDYKKPDADYVKSDVVKKTDTEYAKTDVDEKSHKSKKCTDSKLESISSQDKRLKHENKKKVLASSEITRIDETACKRKLYETVTSITAPSRKKIRAAVENRNFNKYKMNRLSKKLRVYFGDCISMSEDEQEQRILERRFKRRRKKDSVDSCDSGVCLTVSEKTTRVIGAWRNTQKSIRDSITVVEFNEDAAKNTIVDNVAVDKSEGITEKIKTAHSTDNVTNVIKVVNDKIRNGTSTIDSVQTQQDVSREKLINIFNNSTVSQNRIVLNIASRITEQLEINVTVEKANIQTKTEAYSELEPKGRTEGEQTALRPETEVETQQSELQQQAEAQPGLESTLELELEPELESELNAEEGTEVDARTDIDTTYEIPNNVNKDRSQSQESNLDTGDLDALLQMSFNKTFQITSNGNVLSIQESVEENIRPNIVKERGKGVDENGNLKVLPEVHASNNKTIKEEVPDCIEENNNLVAKDIELSSGVEESSEVSISDVHRPCNVNVTLSNVDTTCSMNDSISDIHAPCDANQPITQEPELNSNTEKKNNEPNNGCQGKLRVLSSAELGSRWCPTPIHVSTSTVAQTNAETVSKVPLEHTTPIIVSSVTLVSGTVPLAEPVSTTTPAINVDQNFIEPVNITFVKIFNLIQSLRIPPLTSKFDYDKLLLAEFKKLKSVMKTENYISLINGVIHVLNGKLFVNPQLSLSELFRFSPSLKCIYVRTSKKLSEYYKLRALAISNEMPTSQDAYCSQPSQNMNAKSMQPKSQNAHYASNTNSQSSMNVPPKQLQQNFTEAAGLQPQNNVLQNNVTISSAAGNNPCVYQQNYKVPQQQLFSQRNVSNAYVNKQKPIPNIYGTQSVPVQHSVVPSDGINPLGGQQIHPSNASFMKQQYAPQRVFTQQVNAYYNISPPNYPIQQNNTPSQMKMQNVGMPSGGQQYQVLGTMPNPAYNISRDTQVKQFPQHRPLNYVPQPVQAMFPTSIPYSNYKPNNAQQSEKMNQRMFPMVQSKVPQNQIPKQVPSSQRTRKTCSSKIKQPVLLPKKQEYLPVSLESTEKVFGVLKYLSNADRVVLLKHLDFYFTCTTWLQQEFPTEQWHTIHRQRSTLLYFQTLLKHFMENSVKDVPNKSQGYTVETNILPSTVSDIPKAVHIIVRENDENEKVCYHVNVCTTEQYQTKNVDQSCTTGDENRNVVTVLRQSEEEYKEMDDDSRSKELSNQSQTLDEERMHENEPTEEITVLRKDNPLANQQDVVEKELEHSVSAHAINVRKQSLDELEKLVNTLSQVNEDRCSGSKMCNQDRVQQSSPHLVTVEISSNSDQVTVIDTINMSENISEGKNPTECMELQEGKLKVANTLPSLENAMCNKSAIPFPTILDEGEHFRNPDTNSSLLEDPAISQIADVRSISLETFEKMEESNDVPPNCIEEKIEEEEIKICLFCGKPSTVACSICLEAKYCSRECFELHWEDHYKDCTPVESIHL